MKKLLSLIFILVMTLNSYACHDAGVVEVSAIDNGDGTYTYTFEACVGTEEDTWGFELTLNFLGGTGNIVSNTNCINSSNTVLDICASIPSTSGTGDIEYGDFDNTANPVWSDGTTNECPLITITVDTPIESVDLYGHQFGSGLFGNSVCANTTTTTSSCFTPDYTVEMSKGSCGGFKSSSFTINDPDGNAIGSGTITTNGATETYSVCGCGASLDFTTDCPGAVEVFDGSGTSLGSLSSSGTFALDCLDLPVELLYFDPVYRDGVVVLNWATASERNNSHFDIERSYDGYNWNIVYTIDGQGNKTTETIYEQIDKLTNSDVIYYRLSQTDYDGTRTIEAIRSVQVEKRKIVKIINLLGQEVKGEYEGIKIIIYSNGDQEKTY